MTKRPVIFRTDCTGTLVAIFPDDPYSLAGDSYSARTIHGHTQVGFDTYYTLTPAKPRQYISFFAVELGSDYYLAKRITSKMRENYDAELRYLRVEHMREGDGFGLPDDWCWRDLYTDRELSEGYPDNHDDL